eukprot:CAMPEP_0201665656 /NCGR_PEP_ID=MMETSP0494-20130426/6736_1 /ASSEMBLY_ACC=CAM_ASM_000839 /TAXON_ID=420259 /ORGANISM="Thalassiosira gravida, Strain GMp14c1" /LENGTH=113 /DNA_ID=CAMNT_0048144659 /DNA_START=40 /DNA_END=378 /DNA_ORIENTATION=+
MNSLELAYRLSRISVDRNRSDDANSIVATQEFELDCCYDFDDNHHTTILPPNPSYASSVNSSLSARSGSNNELSRSRCARRNLSALCGSISDTTRRRRRCENPSSYESGPKAW